MAAAREGAVGRCDAAPFAARDVVGVQIVIESRERAVEVFAAEEEEFVAVGGGAQEGGR